MTHNTNLGSVYSGLQPDVHKSRKSTEKRKQQQMVYEVEGWENLAWESQRAIKLQWFLPSFPASKQLMAVELQKTLWL